MMQKYLSSCRQAVQSLDFEVTKQKKTLHARNRNVSVVSMAIVHSRGIFKFLDDFYMSMKQQLQT